MDSHTIQDKFQQSFKRFGNRCAIQSGNCRLTYEELDKKSNRIAIGLIDRGIPKETFIGVLINDRVELIITMIGILKAGCVFIPLDPAHPKKRVDFMIYFTGIHHVISDPQNARVFSPLDGVEFIPFQDLNEGGQTTGHSDDTHETQVPKVGHNPEDPVYVYYTSGTTGKPKAILGKNKGLLHFIQWELDTFAIDENFRFSQFTNIGFDAFLRDILAPLCAGGMICIPGTRDILLNPETLADWLNNTGINLVHCVPALFRSLSSIPLTPHHFKDLKYILLSGEKIEPSHLAPWFAVFDERIGLVNLWGTSETTLAKTYYFISRSDINKERVPVGKPLNGARVIILDENLELCKERTTGELYIRTPYRSFGYCNDPELTRERFIQNPFNNDPEDWLHKTGDLGRLLPDGNLEVLGRNDRQVKIQGIRIELEEIERVLTKHPHVKEAVVIKKEISRDNPTLYAFVVGNGSAAAIGADEAFISLLSNYLLSELPSYMVPSTIIKMETFPRTINGKIDFNKLFAFDKGNETVFALPQDRVEWRLLALWSEILAVEMREISTKRRFFELGGNSLNIMTLISKIHREFDIRISLAEIFKKNTIEAQAALIRESGKNAYTPIEIAATKGHYPVSSAQKRLYILQQLNKGNISYNISRVLEINGDFEMEKLGKIFAALIERHESFRTSFEVIDEEPAQCVHREVPFAIRCYGKCRDNEIDTIIKNFIKPFDLDKAPLLRVGLIELEKTRHILLLDMHHIISDGVSLNILVRDFTAYFMGETLPPLKLQYKDYSEWQNQRQTADNSPIGEQEKYWLKQFEGGIAVLNLPTDYPRANTMNMNGGRIHFQLGLDLSHRIYAFLKETDTTLYMLLLAIYNVLLSRYTGQEDFIVGSPITGRSHPDLENIIGMFVNMLPMRNRPRPELSFTSFLEQVKENALKALENQDYPFDELVKKLGLQGNAIRNPLFDVAFELQNVDTGKTGAENLKKMGNLQITPYPFEHRSSIFDLLLGAVETPEGILMELEYSTGLFKEATAKKISTRYIDVLEQILLNKNTKLKDITIASELAVPTANIFSEEQEGFGF